MNRKIINVCIIIFIIASLCIVEQVLAQQYLKDLNTKTSYIQSILPTAESLNSNEIPYHTNDLHTYWDEKKNILSTFVNHKEIEDIGIEINKMKTAISNNDKEKYEESLNLIKYFISDYQYVVGINLQNLF